MSQRRTKKLNDTAIPMSCDLMRDGKWMTITGQILTIDVSAGGARVQCADDIRVGERMALSATIEGHYFTTSAHVISTSPSRVNGYTVAELHFEDLNEARMDTVELNLRAL